MNKVQEASSSHDCGIQNNTNHHVMIVKIMAIELGGDKVMKGSPENSVIQNDKDPSTCYMYE